MMMLVAGDLHAQVATVTGTARDASTGQALQGVQVSLPNLNMGALSGAAGRFVIAGVPAGTHTVRVELIGYAGEDQEVRVNSGETAVVDFLLREQALALDRIVVTGTAGVTERRQLGHSIGTVDAAAITENSAIANFSQLLQGRVAGVTVLSQSGNIGGGSAMALRGISSISQSSAPLFYIDGVRVSNDAARLNDISPSDIESVEIVKGPAASTLYGSEASNGVVQIITKKGRAGAATFTAGVRQGAQWFNNAEEWIPWNGARDPATGELLLHHPIKAERARGINPVQTGRTQTYNLDVRGGSSDFGYFASISFQDDQGIVPNNWIEQVSGRVNVNAQAAENLRINAGLGYTKGEIARAPESFTGTLGYFGQMIFGNPQTVDTERRGYLQSVPEETWKVDHRDDIHRTTWNLTAEHEPTQWLSHRLTSGIDMSYARQGRLFPRQADPDSHMWGRGLAQGVRSVDEQTQIQSTIDYAATASVDLTSDFRSSTSVGLQYYTRETHVTSAEGENFPASALTTVSTASQRFAGESFSENKSWGAYIQERISWKNQLFITGAIRGDDNSTFGQAIDPVIYPKLSGSWVVSESDFFDVGFIDQFQVRAAWGQAGRQPGSFDAIRTYAPTIARGDAPGVRPANPGNPNLKPERSSEIEIGFDAELFNGRWSLELTTYAQRTTDALLNQSVAPSTGFSGSQWVNIGQVDNQGFDLSTTIRPIMSSGLNWEWNLIVGHTTNKIVDMGEVNDLFFSRSLGHVKGYPVGGQWTKVVVSADYDPATQRAVNILCDGGPGNAALSCADAPRVYMGPSGPDWTGSLGTTLRIGQNLTLSALAEGMFQMRVQSVQQWGRDEVFRNSPEVHTPDEQDPRFLASIQETNTYGWWVNRNDYIRLREVSASYSLPNSIAARIGASRTTVSIAGRNLGFLYLHDEIFDTDPESRLSGTAWNHGRQNVFPQLARIEGSIRVTF